MCLFLHSKALFNRKPIEGEKMDIQNKYIILNLARQCCCKELVI